MRDPQSSKSRNLPGRSDDSGDAPSNAIDVWMTPEEKGLLEGYLLPGASYLEFGSGGSTFLALEHGVGLCRSVESDPDWLATMRRSPAIAEAEASGRLAFEFVDIGPVGEWSIPVNKEDFRSWPSYYLPVWERVEPAPDVVLIDGRFRAACALTALIACPDGTCLLVHDFFHEDPMRANYGRLLDVADIVEREGNLVRLRRKPDVTNGQLLGRLESVWTDFG